MFSRFSGVSHREYGIRVDQAGRGSGVAGAHHPTAARPGAAAWEKTKGPSLGQTFTTPLCLCKLQREADAKRGK